MTPDQRPSPVHVGSHGQGRGLWMPRAPSAALWGASGWSGTRVRQRAGPTSDLQDVQLLTPMC